MSKALFYVSLLCLILIGDISGSKVYPDFWLFIRENNWIPNLIVTIILALITYVYASDTRKMMKISAENLKLETEPNLILSNEKMGPFQIFNISKYPIYVTNSKFNRISKPGLGSVDAFLVSEISVAFADNRENSQRLIEPGQSLFVHAEIEPHERVEFFIEYMYTSTGSKKYTRTVITQKLDSGSFNSPSLHSS
jgi:hypothetical protein